MFEPAKLYLADELDLREDVGERRGGEHRGRVGGPGRARQGADEQHQGDEHGADQPAAGGLGPGHGGASFVGHGRKAASSSAAVAMPWTLGNGSVRTLPVQPGEVAELLGLAGRHLREEAPDVGVGDGREGAEVGVEAKGLDAAPEGHGPGAGLERRGGQLDLEVGRVDGGLAEVNQLLAEGVAVRDLRGRGALQRARLVRAPAARPARRAVVRHRDRLGGDREADPCQVALGAAALAVPARSPRAPPAATAAPPAAAPRRNPDLVTWSI